MAIFIKCITGFAAFAALILLMVYFWLAFGCFRYAYRGGETWIGFALIGIALIQAGIPVLAIFLFRSDKLLWAGGVSLLSLGISICLGFLIPAIVFGLANP
ncbi:MAG: hypothetical protein HC887_09910 [Desulfobacteraceae bacterium]|nr:hypothetical protein [Desulfobacteraceae bacterium]